MDNDQKAKILSSLRNPAIILTVFTALFHKFWFHSTIYGDSFRFFAPLKYLVAQALGKGMIYGWYPWQIMGLPFAADMQAGWFYPLNVLFLPFGFELAYRLFVLIHYPLAAVFMDLFLRRLGVSSYSSLVGALAFSLSGYMIWQHSNPPLLIGYAWAPLALYFMYRALTGRMIWSLFAGAGLAMLIIVGEPQSAWVTAAMFAVMCVAAGISGGKIKRAAMAGLAAFAVAALFGAAQILPTFELMRLSTRAAGLSYEMATTFSFHPGRIIELVWPSPFGALLPDGLYWAYFFLDRPVSNTPFSFSDYIGLSVMTLAFIGLLRGRKPLNIWAGAGMAVFLLIVLGRYTPVYHFLYEHVVTFRIFRYPEKYMAWFTGFTVLAASLGMDYLLETLDRQPARVKKWAVAYIVFSIFAPLAGYLLWPVVVTGIARFPEDGVYVIIIRHLLRTDVQFLAVNVTAGALLLLLAFKSLNKKTAGFVFILLIAFDHYFADVRMMPGGPREIFDFPPVAAMAMEKSGRAKLGDYRILNPGMKFRNTNTALAGYSLLEKFSIWRRNVLLNNLNAINNFESITGYNPIQLLEGEEVYRKNDPKRLGIFNVKYLLLAYGSARPPGTENFQTVFETRLSDLTILKVDGFMPRSYVMESVHYAEGDEDAASIMDSVDLTASSVITAAYKPHDTGEGRRIKPAQISDYETDLVTIRTDADFSGWLVLSDRYYPGWNASVDGRPVKIHKANAFLRGVYLEKGEHVVKFRYMPFSLRIGMFASTVSVLFLIFAGWFESRRRKSSGSFSESRLDRAG